MPKQQSRVQKRPKIVATPLTPTDLIVNGLNGENLRGKTKREDIDPRIIRLFVKRFQRLDSLLSGMSTATIADEEERIGSEVFKSFYALNRMFSRYRLIPSIFPGERSAESGGWRLAWGRVHRSQPWMEISRILAIEKLAAEGRIQAFKQCRQCGRWLYARFSHQKFCTETCKEEFHRSNPGDKQRRRDWARNNYQIHKTKNVK